MNEALEEFDPPSNLCGVDRKEHVAPKIEMELDYSQVEGSVNSLDIKSEQDMLVHSNGGSADAEYEEAGDGEDTLRSGKKMKCKKEGRTCTVCGDKALGYNFDAITCESCKAFFRRNANKAKYPRCMFQGNCNIDPNTRRFCSACRLTKCFVVGMKKEMILGDIERQKRIEKVQQNRAKKLQQQKQMVQKMPADQGLFQTKETDSQSMDELCNNIKMESITPSNTQWSTNYKYPRTAVDIPLESECTGRRVLGDGSLNLIQNIHSAYYSSFGSTAEEVPLQVEKTSLEALMNHIGVLVKLLIKFAKKLEDFTALPQSAQVTLLKGSLLDCITWRSAQMFSIEKGKWMHDDGTETPAQVLNAAFDDVDSDIQEEHIRLISSIKQTIGSDRTIIAIIQCILLFTPHYASVGTRALTSSAQDKYINILKHYLEVNHDWQTAFDLFAKILGFVTATRSYTFKHSKAFLQCDASRLDPLLLEVFDLSALK